MIKWSTMPALLLLAASAFAEGVPTMAVVDFTGYERYSLNRKVPDMLTDELVSTGKFSMVERARLDQILAEQGFQNSGAVGNPVQLGAMLGADYLVTGSLLDVGSSTKSFRGYNTATQTSSHNVTVNVRVLDVKTGRILFSTKKSAGSTSYSSINLDGGGANYSALAQQAVQQIARAMSVNPSLAKGVSQAQGEEIAVTISSQPLNADVEVDGIFYGNAGGGLKLKPGLHTIKVSLPGFSVWEKKVMVQVQGPKSFNVSLQKEPAVLHAETTERVDIRVQQVAPQ
ncbi:MAG: CsgG/HfaB family protein [Panacagrimonas sp.]